MAEFPVLPDVEKLVLEALRFYLPTQATFHVTPPDEWSDLLPYGVSVCVAGKAEDPRFLDQGLFSVQAVAATREAASLLARQEQGALFQAAQDKFHTAEGVISGFHVTKRPVPVRDGLIGKHSGSFMFDATYTLWFGVNT